MLHGLPWVRLSLGLLVSVAAIIVVLMRVDLNHVVNAFRTARYEWLLLAIAASFLSVAIRAQRWRLLCRPADLSFTRAFGILSVGAALTSLLPLRLGDVVRAYLVGALERRSTAWALATIVFERMLDIVALLVIIVLLLPFVSLPTWAIESTQIVAILAIAGVSLICGVWFGRSFLEQRMRPITDRLPAGPMRRMRMLIKHGVDGLAILGQPAPLVQAIAWSAVLWLTTGIVMWSSLIAFGVRSSPSVAMLLVVVSAVAVAVPLSPSAVGVFHAAVIETLVVVSSVDASTAASIAIASHVLLFAPPVICGFASFWFVQGIADRMLMFRRVRHETATPQLVPGGTLPPR